MYTYFTLIAALSEIIDDVTKSAHT